MWRDARADEDAQVEALCLGLYAEDPSPEAVGPGHIRRTLAALRAEPGRGRVVVLDLGAGPVGYALLIRFWSNELGGEICVIDELFVAPAARGQGHAGVLFAALERGAGPWPGVPAALALEVTPDNLRAQALYRRLGFGGKNHAWREPLGRS